MVKSVKISIVNPWLEILIHQISIDQSRLSNLCINKWVKEPMNGWWMSDAFHIVNSKNWFICLGWTRSLALAGKLGSWHRNGRITQAAARQVDPQLPLIFSRVQLGWEVRGCPSVSSPQGLSSPNRSCCHLHRTLPAASSQALLDIKWQGRHVKIIGSGLSPSREDYRDDQCFGVGKQITFR